MDFTKNYKLIRNKKIQCDLGNFTIETIYIGSGGSNNIVIIGREKDINNDLFAIKIFVKSFLTDGRLISDSAELEISIHQFLTERYVLKKRTPHIIGLYATANCKDIAKILKKINIKKIKCYTIEDKIKKRIEQSYKENILCDLALKSNMRLIDNKYKIGVMEFAHTTLNDYLKLMISDLVEYRKKDKTKFTTKLNNALYSLHIILFQVIFTLAIIKKDYKGFLHGDLFMRNILIKINNNYEDDEYIAYHYNNKKFYSKANGPCAKISDFGTTRILDNTDKYSEKIDKNNKNKYNYYHINFNNTKNDIYNFLVDIYDGQNFGGISLMKYMREGVHKSIIGPMVKIISRYLDTDNLDKYLQNNRDLLLQEWSIDGIKLLEDLVLTPEQYLSMEYFNMFTSTSFPWKVVEEFNK